MSQSHTATAEQPTLWQMSDFADTADGSIIGVSVLVLAAVGLFVLARRWPFFRLQPN